MAPRLSLLLLALFQTAFPAKIVDHVDVLTSGEEDEALQKAALDPRVFFHHMEKSSRMALIERSEMPKHCSSLENGTSLNVGDVSFALDRIRESMREQEAEEELERMAERGEVSLSISGNTISQGYKALNDKQVLSEIQYVLGEASMNEMSLISTEDRHLQLAQAEWNAMKALEKMRECGARINKVTMNMTYEGTCKHRGRVFGVGLFKTGTTTLTQALNLLGYKYSKPTIGFYTGYTTSPKFMLDDSLVNQQIDSWTAWKGQKNSIATTLDDTWCAADGPWLFMYERMDKWYPGSKFILTQRESTYHTVNSDMKMATQRSGGLSMIEYTELQRQHKKGRIYGHSLVDFALLVARRYDLHNEAVRSHFAGRKDDLLEIVFKDEHDHPWDKISSFLGGCDTSKVAFPQLNSAPSTQKDYDIEEMMKPGGAMDWRQFDFVALEGFWSFKIVPKTGPGTHKIGNWTYVCTYCEGFHY